jgi:glutamate carboxypeptidase
MDPAVARQRAHAHRDHYLALLERLVRIESPSRDRVGADAFVDALSSVLRDDGWTLRREPRADVGDIVIARTRHGAPGPATLLLCHYDTVHPRGSFGAQPWRVEGDRAAGPGVLDMKAGIVAGVLAPRIVQGAGASLAGPLTLLVTSDEEIGSDASRALIEAEARQHARVLVLEPSRDDGALKAGRKGVAQYAIGLHGRASHAGLAPFDGASALVELAHLVLELTQIGNAEVGTTVTPTVAQAGTTSNVVAERATLAVDVRVADLAEAERVDAAVRGYAVRDPRVRVEVAGGLNRPPMEANAVNAALLERALALASAAGWSVEGSVVGGGSDGNFTSALGVPTLDGLGSVGGGAHTSDEHIRIGESLDRLGLLASLLMEA